jgi:allantoin racemase
MRILVINPVGTSRWDVADKTYLRKFARKDTQVDVASLERGPESIEDYRSIALVCPEMLKLAKKKARKYDAMLVNCFGDPCLEALRETVPIPVLGAGETSMLVATIIGQKFAVVSPTESTVRHVERNARRIGLNPTTYSIVPLNLPVLQLEKNRKATIRSIAKLAEECLAEGAEVIVLGCTGLAYMSEEVRKHIRAPLLEPASTTLKIAEALADLRPMSA